MEIRGEWYVGDPVDDGMNSAAGNDVPAGMRPILEVYTPKLPADRPERNDGTAD